VADFQRGPGRRSIGGRQGEQQLMPDEFSGRPFAVPEMGVIFESKKAAFLP